MPSDDFRPGEIALPFDPRAEARDASLVFIGRIRSGWRTRSECPKNMREARERGQGAAAIEIDPPWRQGLSGVCAGQPLFVLYWMDRARRDLIVQMPRHSGKPSGAFALRSPVRPNPVALAAVRCLEVDIEAGRIAIDAIDALDGTPVIDLKPWLASVDIPPGD